MPLPSQPQLVLIHRPRRDVRLSRPWCEEAQAEIRTRNLPIANPALYHTATCPLKKVKVHALDIVPLRSESPPQKRSARMARLLKVYHSLTCTPTRSSAIGMSHICRCLPSYSWYSFTDPGGMEG